MNIELFCAIVEMYNHYIFPIDEKTLKKYDVEFLTVQKELRKNVDEAISKAIQGNPDVLFIRMEDAQGSYYLLWEYLIGTERTVTLLPKTMEVIMKHPTAPLVKNMLGYILPWIVGYQDPCVLNLVAENQQCRTWQSLSTGKNLAMKLVGFIGEDNSCDHSLSGEAGIQLIDKFLDYRDCSIQQDFNGDNIGTLCALRARVLLGKYYEDKQSKINSKEENNRYYNLAVKLKDLVMKSMLKYPETAEQERFNGDTLAYLYILLCEDFTHNTAYFNETQNQIKKEQEAREKSLKELIPTVESLTKKLTIK